MPHELIITEKPSSAKKIAEALADGKVIKESNQTVPYYLVTHKNKDIVIGSAVGHLYGLAEKVKAGWKYPVFDIEWKDSSENSKKADYIKKYITTLKKLAKDATEFTVATDYDIEGEVIGLNIVRFICKKKDANRMKYSTLTKPDLVKSYETKAKTLDWPQANAGETRHFLDWMYGINYSRALSLAIKNAGQFKIMSIGRVQGPALKILVDKEEEIGKFVPVPYWQLELHGSAKTGEITALHVQDKFWEKEEAEKSLKNCKGQKAAIKEITKNKFKQNPPTPFDLTTLQMEAYKTLGITPQRTLEYAQTLYTEGYISYPRTSSQKLPKELNLKNILQELGKNATYAPLAKKVLAGKLVPTQGEKEDPAHPAIHPTGIQPKKLEDREARVYDLIVHRFFAIFGEPATRETQKITIDVNKELFTASGTITVEKGWHELYGKYVMLKDEELPKMKEGEEIKVKEIKLLSKETSPPKRYTAASIIKELEKRGLGTKATRASIIETLYQRGYVNEASIQATELGIKICHIIEKYMPEMLDEELTRHFEDEMEGIRERKFTEEKVLDEAKSAIIKILEKFKKNESNVGQELLKATLETRDEMSYVGKCNRCGTGDLQIRRGKYGFFVACNRYPECQNTFALPPFAKVVPAKKECPVCGSPMVKIIKARKQPQEICINKECPTKKQLEDEAPKLPPEKMKCPNCGGQFVLKQSFYGKFYGCSNYPKCRTMMKLDGTVVQPKFQPKNDGKTAGKSKKETAPKKPKNKLEKE
ncbi:DNA topoisomerase I [Candidatus Woesearchaeota archaeon]|nr:DNA topoisomerase I [Candidatus Woesearchaeota archaeon]